MYEKLARICFVSGALSSGSDCMAFNIEGDYMKTFNYKGYFVTLEKQHNGSIRAVADNDSDRFGIVYYDYSITELTKRIKTQCTYRLTHNVREGYSL